MNNPLINYFYILTVKSVYTRDQQRCAEADRNPQNIWDPRKDCGSFVEGTSKSCGRYIVGTLTNKDNISM